MKTAKVVINVDDGTLKLKDQDEEVTFNVLEAVQEPTDEQTSLKGVNEVLSVIVDLGKLQSCLKTAPIASLRR